ncbi:hypothetical protein D3C85_1565840 [compost metagenome]
MPTISPTPPSRVLTRVTSPIMAISMAPMAAASLRPLLAPSPAAASTFSGFLPSNWMLLSNT